MANKKKKQVGIFSFTSDEGCTIYLIEIFNQKLLAWLEKMELKYFLSIKDKAEIKNFDIVLVEGVISSRRELKEIKEIRKNTKILIALGSCAITAQPSGQRNFFNAKQQKAIAADLKKFKFLPKCLAIKDVVKVDAEVPGCPINEEKFIQVFEQYL